MTHPAPGRRVFGGTWRLLLKELSAFGIVGGVSLLIDLGLFQLLYAQVGLGAVTSRLLSSLVSMTVAYFAHRHWSFSHRARTGVKREYVLFLVVNGVTLLVSLGVVAFVRYPLGQDDALVLQVANIASIGLSTIVRYFAYRRWVFPAHDPADSDAPATRAADSATPAEAHGGTPDEARSTPGRSN